MSRRRGFGHPSVFAAILAVCCAAPAWSGTLTKGTVAHPGGNFCTDDTLATFVSGGEDVIVIHGDAPTLGIGAIEFSPPPSGGQLIFEGWDQGYYKTVSVYTLVPGLTYTIRWGACGITPSGDDQIEIIANDCSAPSPSTPLLDCFWREQTTLTPLVRFPTTLFGYPTDRVLILENSGTNPLSSTLSVSCSEFSIVGSTSVSLPVGGQRSVVVRYAPTIEGTVAGELTPECSGILGFPGGSLLLASALGPRIVVGTATQILRRRLDGSADIQMGTGATHVDLALSGGKEIYAALASGAGGIHKSSLDGPFVQIVQGGDAWCVDVDPVAGKVYWGASGSIRRANTDGTNIEVLPISYPGDSPVDIAVDPEGGKIYWTSVWVETWIMRANLDGSNEVALLQLPNGGNPRLALDRYAGWLYWSEDTTSRIRRMRLDGSHVQTMLTPDIQVPASVGIDAGAGTLYWTDSGTNSVHRVDLDGANHDEIMTGTPGLSGLLLLVPPPVVNERVYWTDADSDRIRSVRKNDGTDVEDLSPGLAEPRGLALDADAGKLYVVDQGTDRITRLDLDGTSVEHVVTTGLDAPEDIALDVAAGKMYWTDSGATNRIQRANLNGSGVETLIDSGLCGVRGIALDPAAGKMYWTETMSGCARICRASMAPGSTPEVLISGLALPPLDIALDVADGRMWWAECGVDDLDGPSNLKRANLDGSGVEAYTTPTASMWHVDLDLGARQAYCGAVFDPSFGLLAGIVRTDMDTGDLVFDGVANLFELPRGLVVAPRPGFPETSDAEDHAAAVPRIHLTGPRPNPFNPATRVSYVHAGGGLDVRVYDVRGRLVRTLVAGPHPAGQGSLVWAGTDDQGRAVSSGLYVVQLRSGGQQRSVKAVLVR